MRKAIHTPQISSTFHFSIKAEKNLELYRGKYHLLWSRYQQPHATSPQPWQVQHNKIEGNTEPFAKALTYAAATRLPNQTGRCTVPIFPFFTQNPQAQAGEVSCTARPCQRGAHGTGPLSRLPQPLGHVTWACYSAAGALRGTIRYSLLFTLYSESQYKEKSSTKKLRTTYGIHLY